MFGVTTLVVLIWVCSNDFSRYLSQFCTTTSIVLVSQFTPGLPMQNICSALLPTLRTYFKTLYGEKLKQLILYGSQARGDAKPDSDIDILVILADPVDAWTEIDRTSQFIADLCLEHTVVISTAFVSSHRFQQEKSPFFLNVHKEGVAL